MNPSPFRSFLLRFLVVHLLLMLVWLSGSGLAAPATVVIDAGHGGHDPGAIWSGEREESLTLDVAVRLERLLRERGIHVVMTRRSDKFVTLQDRARMADAHKDALLVSIHFNASTDRTLKGFETYYYRDNALAFAKAVQKTVPGRASLSSNGIRQKGYTVLASCRAPAILVECGYLSHPLEGKRCQTALFRQVIAEGIAQAITGIR
jgi:N-acetylmuramoyl-L-alanine amidase